MSCIFNRIIYFTFWGILFFTLSQLNDISFYMSAWHRIYIRNYIYEFKSFILSAAFCREGLHPGFVLRWWCRSRIFDVFAPQTKTTLHDAFIDQNWLCVKCLKKKSSVWRVPRLWYIIFFYMAHSVLDECMQRIYIVVDISIFGSNINRYYIYIRKIYKWWRRKKSSNCI